MGANDQGAVKMEISEYKNIFENEKTHFFYVSTHNLVASLISKWVGRKELAILDAGCGTGGLMERLSRFGQVVGVDYNDEAIRYARKRGLTIRKASLTKLPFKNNHFDLVICIDVIYHRGVGDDVAATREIRRVLKPGGILILRVPANKFLLSAHDRHVHTARRYSKGELAEKIKLAGLVVRQISYVHSPIFLASLFRVALERLTHQADNSSVGRVNPVINQVLTMVLNLEGRLITNGLGLPFGQGLIAVATPNRQSSPGQKRR